MGKSEERNDLMEAVRNEQQNARRNNQEMPLDALRARVDKIHIDGLGRTKDDIIEDCIRDVFKATNFEEVLQRTNRARHKLDELGCFKDISVYIDTSKGQGATPNGLEVTFNVHEFKRVAGSLKTQAGNNEGSLLVGLRAPNLFGRGERVQVEYSHGSRRTSNFNVGFVKPFRGANRPILTASLFQANSEWPSSGYRLLERGLLLDFAFHSAPLVKHNIQWQGDVRDVACLTRAAAFEVREQSGLSLKSALRHVLSMDVRDDVIFPSRGSLFRVTTEMAGLGGNVGFVKNELFLQTNYSVLEDLVLQATVTGGVLNPTAPDTKVNLIDKFYLGGAMSVRGFQQRGLGPHADGNSVGSMGFWAAGLHLFAPLPFRPGRGGFGDMFRTHFFVNAGNVGDFVLTTDKFSDLFQKNVRISYGLGLALKFGNMARLEVNYCLPVAAQKSDHTQPGIQFGVGLQFL